MDFYVEDKVLDIGVKIIFAIVREIDNHNISEEWRVYRERRLQELLEEYRGIDVHADPVLEGFNILHDKSGVKRRKNIPASENLIKLLVKHEGMLFINQVVDIYNVISLESKLALGAHDIDKVEGNVTLLISHDPDTGRWNLLSVRPSDDSRLDTGRERIELTDYDKISFGSGANVPTRDNRGSLIPFTQWEKAGRIVGYECPLSDRVELEEVPLPRADGCRYWLQIILVDVYNAPYASELFELEE